MIIEVENKVVLVKEIVEVGIVVVVVQIVIVVAQIVIVVVQIVIAEEVEVGTDVVVQGVEVEIVIIVAQIVIIVVQIVIIVVQIVTVAQIVIETPTNLQTKIITTNQEIRNEKKDHLKQREEVRQNDHVWRQRRRKTRDALLSWVQMRRRREKVVENTKREVVTVEGEDVKSYVLYAYMHVCFITSTSIFLMFTLEKFKISIKINNLNKRYNQSKSLIGGLTQMLLL